MNSLEVTAGEDASEVGFRSGAVSSSSGTQGAAGGCELNESETDCDCKGLNVTAVGGRLCDLLWLCVSPKGCLLPIKDEVRERNGVERALSLPPTLAGGEVISCEVERLKSMPQPKRRLKLPELPVRVERAFGVSVPLRASVRAGAGVRVSPSDGGSLVLRRRSAIDLSDMVGADVGQVAGGGVVVGWRGGGWRVKVEGAGSKLTG